ncbi:MAG: xanthine phosphoribosyltransferase, partial [Clostridiales bacterium]
AHTHPTKILTMEASGISVAVATAIAFGNIPVVFAKKTAPSTMIEDVYAADVKSFTKGTVSSARVAKKYLTKADQVLIIDDFLAHGEAGLGLISLIEQAGAELLGFGAVIEKEFQGGGARIRAKGCQLESLAVIEKICDGVIYFR